MTMRSVDRPENQTTDSFIGQQTMEKNDSIMMSSSIHSGIDVENRGTGQSVKIRDGAQDADVIKFQN